MSARLTEALDKALVEVAANLPERMAVVAIGGYGREELCLQSDVDLMLLHAETDPAGFASELFRPLWDAKLRVGHSVRTLKEAAAAARERYDTHTTLLTSRLVVGDEELFSGLMGRVASVTKARPLRRHLVEDERERRRREPYLLMAADVKNGRGGLRVAHGFDWERKREALIGRFSSDDTGGEFESVETLLRVRNGLHAVTGRPHDVLSPELREPVARWLGVDQTELVSMSVEACHIIDRLATRRWPETLAENRGGVLGRVVGRPPPLSGNTRPTVDVLVRALETGAEGRAAFERMWETGLLGDVLPEWGRLRTLPQMAQFHEHPVADHLWRTVAEMQELIAGDDHYGRVAGEVDSPRTLLLAAFLHDIGKGAGGDHAEIGAGIAKALCARLGIPREETASISDAVRLHLLLPVAATSRDLDDRAVISEVASTVGDLRLLQILYLLTVADSRATGRTMWSDWKATLLRSLFARCAAELTPDEVNESGTTGEEVLARSSSEAVEEHLRGMPDGYLRSSTSDEVLWHVGLISELSGRSRVGIRDLAPVPGVTVVGRHVPDFRRLTTEAFAANGIDVLEARLFTRSDGVVVDSYRVRDDRTGGEVRSERWQRFESDLEAGLTGELDTASRVQGRASSYSEVPGDRPEVRAAVDDASGDLVVTVECADRIGRLAEILGILADRGLEIRLAQVDSRQGQVIDTFHVVFDELEAEAIARLEREVAEAIIP